MELGDLDWEDRETILRLLFSKMNTGEPATNWRDNMPASRSASRTTSKDNHPDLNEGFREDQYYDEEGSSQNA